MWYNVNMAPSPSQYLARIIMVQCSPYVFLILYLPMMVCVCVSLSLCVAHAVKALDLAKMQETTSQLKHQEEIKVKILCQDYIFSLSNTMSECLNVFNVYTSITVINTSITDYQ